MTRKEAERQARLEKEKARQEAEAAREARLAEAVRRDPRIEPLTRGDVERFQRVARAIAGDPQRAVSLAERAREEARRDREELNARLAALGLPENYLEVWYECGLCADSGLVGEAPRRLCACVLRRVNQLLRESGEEEQTFERFDESVFPAEQRTQALAARNVCLRYADSFPRNEHRNLLLLGESGLGKTFLLNCIAHRLEERGFSPCSVTAYRLFSFMRGAHFGDGEAAAALQQMVDCQVLLVDDLGSEPLMNNITVEYFFMLYNERLSGGRHTLTAANLLPEDLKARYGERLMSRLVSQANTEILRLRGRDLRLIRRD